MEGSDWVCALPHDARTDLLAAAYERRLRKAAVIYAGDGAVTAVQQLVDGRVRQFIVDESGSELFVYAYRRNEILGESLGLDRRPCWLWLAAVGDVTLRCWDPGRLNQLRVRYPSIDAAILSQVTSRLRHTLLMQRELVTLDSAGRVAGRLCWLAERAGPGGSIDLGGSQDDVATMANVSRQTVSRVFASLREKGLVTVGYKQVTVRDLAALRAYRDGRSRRG